MTPTITVLYTCAQCGALKREVKVPAREDHEDVVHWVREVVGRAVGADHATRNCSATTMDHVMIPAPKDADWIGQAPKQ
jgi:hypothetical protein